MSVRRQVRSMVGNRPPGGCVRHENYYMAALAYENACFAVFRLLVGVPVGIADVAARRSATYLNLELVDGLVNTPSCLTILLIRQHQRVK